MATAIIGIGLPGSGKSTFFRNFIADMPAEVTITYICPDDIRLQVWGDASDQQHNEEVWAEAYVRIEHALRVDRTIVLDATNTRVDQRRELVKHCRKQAGMVQGIWFVTPNRLCLKRNRWRNRVVPENAMHRMMEWLLQDPPTVEDGFDSILRVDTSKRK